jgi:hypothetical protein
MIEGDCLKAQSMSYASSRATWISPAVSLRSQRQPGQNILLRPPVLNACRAADLDNRPDGDTGGLSRPHPPAAPPPVAEIQII